MNRQQKIKRLNDIENELIEVNAQRENLERERQFFVADLQRSDGTFQNNDAPLNTVRERNSTNIAHSTNHSPIPDENEKNSSYFSIFYTGDNKDQANMAAYICTNAHSEKIKAGNALEKYIASDTKDNSNFKVYQNEYITEDLLKDCDVPCVIFKAKFNKKIYEDNGLKCSNKERIEIDVLTIDTKDDKDDNKFISLFEKKSGTNFDTKKSYGEVEKLIVTNQLCEKLGFKTNPPAIVCYDAKCIDDISIKTSLNDVELMIYENFARKIGLDGVSSRVRIDEKFNMFAKVYNDTFNENIKNYYHKFLT